MAQRPKRSRDISLTIHSFSLTSSPSGSYGLKLSGRAPAMVAMVQSGSVACRAGLQVGDFVLKISGHDTRTADGEIVLRKLKEAVGRTVEVGVARPFPVPVTDKEKMRALLVLQTKLDSGTIFKKEAPDYQTAVQNALVATQDILGDLGLDMPQSVPDTSRQAQAQEVELQMYDSDSLPSPPPSSESEGEKDPLLDFTREDTLTYTPGQPSQTLAESVREATEALEGIQKLTAGLKKKERQPAALVSSKASFQPSGEILTSGGRQSKSPAVSEDSKSPAPFEVHEDLQWVEPGRSLTGQSPQPVLDFESPPPPPPPPPHASKSSQPPPPQPDQPPTQPPTQLPTQPPTSQTQTSPRHPPAERDAPLVPPHGRGRERKAEEQGRRGKEESKGGVVLRRQAPRAAAAADHVPLRIKLGKDRPAGLEEEGIVAGSPAGYKKLHPPPSHPAPEPPSEDPVIDLADQETALRGLPPSIVSWHSEEVAVWLFQLSPTLSHHYRACFSRHDITGQALMRLNLAKLKSMGIDNIKHCRQLALEIAKLKIYQESLELRELEEENQLSFI